MLVILYVPWVLFMSLTVLTVIAHEIGSVEDSFRNAGNVAHSLGSLLGLLGGAVQHGQRVDVT